MENGRAFINAFVDITGGETIKIIKGVFDLVENPIVNYFLHPTSDTQRPSSISGILNEKISTLSEPIPLANVRVSFIKDYTVNDTTNTQYTGEKIVSDYCMTDSKGEYTVFLEPGIYAIRIDGGKYANKVFVNQTVENGLTNEYYLTAKGLISKRYKDVVEIANSNKKLITGFLYDEHDKPLKNAEIIISSGKNVEVYLKTKEDGKYQFLLDNGVYDLRLRAQNAPVKIIKGFDFKTGQGFMESINAQSKILGRDNWIWIYK